MNKNLEFSDKVSSAPSLLKSLILQPLAFLKGKAKIEPSLVYYKLGKGTRRAMLTRANKFMYLSVEFLAVGPSNIATNNQNLVGISYIALKIIGILI